MYWDTVKRLGAIILCWTTLLSAQEVPEIQALLEERQSLVKRRLNQDLKAVGDKYIASLQGLEAQFKAEGSLDRVLALQAYLESFKPRSREPEVPEALTGAEGFTARQAVWHNVKREWNVRRARELVTLADQADALLKKLEVDATREDRIDDALTYRKERETMAKDEKLLRMRRILERAERKEDVDDEAGSAGALPALIASIQPSVVLYLNFDRDQNGRVTDMSRQRHSVESSNVTWVREGAKGGAVQLAGRDNSFMKVKSHSTLELTESLTLSFWMKPDELNKRRNPIYKSYGAEYTMTLEVNGQINFFHGFAGRDAQPYRGFSTKANVKEGEWTHVCLVRDVEAKTVVWYLNGKKDKQFNLNKQKFAESDRDIMFGHGYAGPFKGLLDEVLILNRALDDRQVGLLYRSVGGR